MQRRAVLNIILVLPWLMSVSPALAAKAAVFTGLIEGTAAGGFDVVSYHTENAAVPGNPDNTAEFEGAIYRFVSDTNRTLFNAGPANYIPVYGGYCAYAVSQGYTAEIDPEAFSIVDGKLYLNYSKSVRAKWQQDTAAYIAAGNANWPKVLND